MMISVEQSVECFGSETEVLGENLPQCRVVYHKSHISDPDFNPDRRRSGKPATNWLSYGKTPDRDASMPECHAGMLSSTSCLRPVCFL
jgi:hypothetical protein